MPDAKKPKKHIHRYSGVHLCRKRWKLIHKNIILYDGLSEPLKKWWNKKQVHQYRDRQNVKEEGFLIVAVAAR